MAEEQRVAQQKQQHADECKATYAKRLKDAQVELAQVALKKAQITGRCRRIQPACTIIGRTVACRGVSADDVSFYEETCMNLAYADQIVLIDESEECADVDAVTLRVSLAATAAEMDPIRAAKP